MIFVSVELRCGAGQRAGKVALKRSPLKRLEAVEVEKPLDRSRSWRSTHGKHESRHPCCAAHDSGIKNSKPTATRKICQQILSRFDFRDGMRSQGN